MTSRTHTIQKENLERRLATLSEEYAAVNDQIDRENNDVTRLRLQRQAQNLLHEIQQVEDKLNLLETSEENFNQIHLDIEANLPNIDFQQALNTVESVIKQFKRDGGAALFLLEDTYSLA